MTERDLRDRFRTICEHAPVMIDQFDENGRCLLWNRECERNLGYTREEVEACSEPLSLFYPDETTRARVLESIRLADGTFREFEVRAKDGTIRVQQWANFKLPSGARISVGHDITEVRAFERQLRAASKMQALGQLTGGIAHEFNNLLTIIRANADLADQRLSSPAELRENLAAIRQSTDHGAQLVKKLLAFGRRERLRIAAVDLSEQLGGLLDALRAVLPDSIELHSNLAEAGVVVAADGGAVEQMVINLATNAADALDGPGIVTLSTSTRVIDGGGDTALGLAPGEYGCLAVTDTGHGMSDEVRARAFEPFFTTKAAGAGSGLGLAMVYGLAKQQGGGVELTSEPSVGTTVRVYIPRTSAPAEKRPDTASPFGEGEGRILIVEDEPALLNAARALLTESGYRVVGARDGARALAVLKSAQQPFDLVITDLMMPGMSGSALFSAARDIGIDCPFLFTTGNPIDAGMPAQGGMLLEKPWTADEIINAVRTALESDESTGSAD